MSNLLALLDAVEELPQAVELRELSCRDLGDVVVDVGCGGGRAAGELAARGVRAIGVDVDPAMVEVAARRWPAAEFRVGDATDLPLESGSVTGYRADKVLHALAEPERAVAEARRVLAPGGRAVLVGQDWDGIVVDGDEPAGFRRRLRERADRLPSPWVARRYRNLLLDHGFGDVTVEARLMVFTEARFLPLVMTLGYEDGDEEWAAEQARRAGTNRLFLAMPIFLAVGTRPD